MDVRDVKYFVLLEDDIQSSACKKGNIYKIIKTFPCKIEFENDRKGLMGITEDYFDKLTFYDHEPLALNTSIRCTINGLTGFIKSYANIKMDNGYYIEYDKNGGHAHLTLNNFLVFDKEKNLNPYNLKVGDKVQIIKDSCRLAKEHPEVLNLVGEIVKIDPYTPTTPCNINIQWSKNIKVFRNKNINGIWFSFNTIKPYIEEPKPTFKFDIGDIVEVSNNGATFDTYGEMANIMNLSSYKQYEVPNDGYKGIVIARALHTSDESTRVYGIRIDSQDYIIGERGLILYAKTHEENYPIGKHPNLTMYFEDECSKASKEAWGAAMPVITGNNNLIQLINKSNKQSYELQRKTFQIKRAVQFRGSGLQCGKCNASIAKGHFRD